jgi:hypothetical protein
MTIFIIILKLIVSLSLFNVWLVQYNKSTKWRGADANTIIEEFKAYGLSKNMCFLVGFLKVTLAILLIVSIWVPVLELYSALGLAFLLTGSILMHFKIKDPLYKSFPAALFLILCLLIAYI